MRKFVSLLMTFTLALMMVPAPAFAQMGDLAAASLENDAALRASAPVPVGESGSSKDEAADAPASSAEPDSESISLSGKIDSSTSAVMSDAAPLKLDYDGLPEDDLFEAYVDRAFEEAATPVVRRVMLKAQAAAADTSARSQLDSYNKLVYDALLPHIKAVANGSETDTEFKIPASQLIRDGGLKERYYSEDLGNVKMLEDGTSTITQEALKAFANVAGQNYVNLLYALLQDCNYDLYWFDKVGEVARPILVGWDGYIENGKPYLTFSSSTIVYQFKVIRAYSETGELGTFKTKGILAKVGTAAANAVALVREHAGDNDIAKLDAYRSYICENVDYDHPAAEDGAEYGDPSQLISVFDGDASTRAICEGYSKAFKQLCDLSDFDNPSIHCYTTIGMWHSPTGKYISHMWNNVLVNGHSYLVDVTNCDTDSDSDNPKAGNAGSWWDSSGNGHPGTGLFLVGHTEQAPVSADSNVSSSLYQDGYRIDIPNAKSNFGSTLTVSYYPQTIAASVLPAGSLDLASWDCPLGEDAATALAIDARVMAVAGGEPIASEAMAQLVTDYSELTSPQKSLVQIDPNTLNTSQIESDTAAKSVKTLEWGKASELKGGTYTNKAAAPGNVAWTCADASLKTFKVKLYKEGVADPAIACTVKFPAQAARTSYSYYLPLEYAELESGRYYFTVTPVLAAGAPAPDEGVIQRSDIWTYTAPAAELHAPAGIELVKSDSTGKSAITWTQPSKSIDPTMSCVSQYAFMVYHADKSLTADELAAVTFDTAGAPHAKSGDDDVTFEKRAGVRYSVRSVNTTQKCQLDLAKFMKNRVSEAVRNADKGTYYFYVRTISGDISKYRSNLHSDLLGALSSADVAREIQADLAAVVDDVAAGSGGDVVSASSIADKLTSSFHPAQLEIAMEDAQVADKVSTLDAMTGVAVSVEQGEGAPDELFAGAGPSVVGAALNPLASDVSATEGEVKLVVDAAAGADPAIPEGYDAGSAQAFSMSLQGVRDQENLTVPVRVTLPVPAGMAADEVAVLHYEEGAAEPAVIEPVIQERDGVSYASVVLTSFSDFAFVQSAGAAQPDEPVVVTQPDEPVVVTEPDVPGSDEIAVDPVVDIPVKPVATKKDNTATTKNSTSKSASKSTRNTKRAGKTDLKTSPIGYTVKYSAGKGSGLMTPQVAKPGSTITLKANAFTWKSHKFTGWKGSDGKTYANKAKLKVTRNLTLTAQWAKVKTSKKTMYILTNAKKSKLKVTTSKKAMKKKLKSGWKKLAVVKSGTKKVTKLYNPNAKRSAAKYRYEVKPAKVSKLLTKGWRIATTAFYEKR